MPQDFKTNFKTLKVIFTLGFLLLSSCQTAPTSKQIEDTGKLFFHPINQESSISKTPLEILVDGKKIEDVKKLDKSGIPQNIGKHAIGFKGLPFNSGLGKIDYNIKKNQNFHLYYCELDGSLHGYTQSADGMFHIYQQSSDGSFNEYTQSVEEKKFELKKICKPRIQK